MAPKVWTKAETLKLIEMYEAYPALWDFTNADHKNRNIRNNILNIIGTEFNVNPEEVNRKLHNLKGQFYQEIRKIKAKKSGSSLNDNYVSNWSYFNNLKFLDSGKGNDTTDTLQHKENVLEIESSATSFASDKINETHAREWQAYEKLIKITKQKNEEELMKKYGKILKTDIDDDQIFGDFVASSLRSLTNIKKKKHLKLLIQKAIIEIQESDDENYYSYSTVYP